MKNLIITLFLTCASVSLSNAQLASGTVAPNFTATDINGNTHNLYDLLNQGKTVYLEFSATWCIICWNYHNTHALKNLWNTYGPPGTNEAYVMFIESYQPSNTNCLYGSSGCNNNTKGDWVTGEPFPIIDDFTIGDLYDVSFYPIVYCICPADKKLYQTGTQDMAGLWAVRTQNCATSLQITGSTIQDAACFGSSSGAIDITHSGGVGPFTYNWSNGATTQDLTNVVAGTYTCTIATGNGATSTTSPLTVHNPTSTLSLVQSASTLVGCNGVAATVTVNAAGGWGSYNYAWNNGQSGPLAAGLNPGNYTVTVTDSGGCTKTLISTVAAPVLPTANIATPSSLTCTQNSVAINGSASSSGPGYTYLWTTSGSGSFTGSTNTANTTVNATGIYTLLVTNTATACSSTASVNVSSNTTPPVAVATSPGNLNCKVSQLQLSGNGSSQGNNFTYQWSTTNGNIVSGQSSFSPLVNQSGVYKIVVTNTINGCTSSAATTLNQSPPVTASIVAPVNVACFGGANGSAGVSAGGGNGAFSYLWNTGNTTSGISGLAAGMYAVTVTDAETCTATASLTISQPAVLLVNASATAQTAVGQNNGSATATPTGGTSNYTYSWNTGATTATISNLAPGSYTVTITDAHGCTAAQTVVVNLYNCAIAAQSTVTNVSCINAANGMAAVSLSGGNGSYTYAWSNGATTASTSGLAAGTYLVTVTDGAGCTTLATANIVQPSAIIPNASATAQTGVGLNNGTASLMPSGGSPGYTYQWSTGATTTTLNGLSPGAYTATVSDTHGCSATQTVVVNGYTCAIAGVAGMVNASCANSANGAVSVTMTGGTAPFLYQWNTGATTSSVNGLPAGNYIVTVTDAAGCSTLATTVVTQPAIILVNATATPLTAVNANNGTATAAPTGGAGTYTYFWSNGATTASISNLTPGNYTVTVTDGNGCTVTQTVAVNPYNCLLTAQPSVANASCSGMANGSVSLNITGGTPPFNYQWDNGGNLQSLNNQLPGTYYVTVSDISGCQVITPVTIGVTDVVPPVLSCPGDIYVCPNSNIVHFNAPVATDNCGFSGSQLMQTGGLPSGSFFPLGTTTEAFRFIDAGGNASECSFNIVVSAPVSFTTVQVIPSTNNQENGAIDIALSGGTPPYFYYWTNSAGQLISTQEDLYNLSPGFYAVKVNDVFGCEFFYAVEVKTSTGSFEPEWMSGIAIHPNPAGDFTHIEFNNPLSEKVVMDLTDASGKVWLKRNITDQHLELDCSNLPAGIYAVTFRSEHGVGRRKLVVYKN